MPNPANDGGDDLVGDAIPKTPVERGIEKVDITAPWYRPAKQYLRREQWNADILHLLNRLPGQQGETTTIRYVGLPGQHYLDLLSMGRICHTKNLRVEYLGFRTGGGPDAEPEPLAELAVLSNQTHFSPNSATFPDSVSSIGLPNAMATQALLDRGPFDVVNLDVCGGVLHGDTAPLLNAIKYVLNSQLGRPLPWLLFVTTTAKAEDISADVITKFFSAVTSNCNKIAGFRQMLDEVTTENLGLAFDECLRNPTALRQDGFLRYFTLAFGKWLLANVFSDNPRSDVTLRSVYSFRNTDRDEPEMLSLAYLIAPVIAGGADPTGLTVHGILNADDEYERLAMSLVLPSIEGVTDLDKVWHQEPALKQRIILECEELLKAIGVDDDGLATWRERHGLPSQ